MLAVLLHVHIDHPFLLWPLATKHIIHLQKGHSGGNIQLHWLTALLFSMAIVITVKCDKKQSSRSKDRKHAATASWQMLC